MNQRFMQRGRKSLLRAAPSICLSLGASSSLTSDQVLRQRLQTSIFTHALRPRGAGGAPGFSGVLVQSGSWNAGRFARASVSTCIDVSPSSSGSRDSASSHFSLAISAPPIFNALRNVLVSQGASNNLKFVLTPRVSHRPKV